MKIKVKVITCSSQPGIEKDSIVDLKVRLKSAPVEGKANQELIRYLADYFKTTKSNIEIIKGKNFKNKIIEIKKEES
ncbi:DUF167 domain-containing protein [Patescibacteria group bacterium]|nr:DUF167 domain-containing protein [Patescibacteria group bacterium]